MYRQWLLGKLRGWGSDCSCTRIRIWVLRALGNAEIFSRFLITLASEGGARDSQRKLVSETATQARSGFDWDTLHNEQGRSLRMTSTSVFEMLPMYSYTCKHAYSHTGIELKGKTLEYWGISYKSIFSGKQLIFTFPHSFFWDRDFNIPGWSQTHLCKQMWLRTPQGLGLQECVI